MIKRKTVSWFEPGDKIPCAWARCCRFWIIPAFQKIGRCGICDVRPEYLEMLPESDWPEVKPRKVIRD